MKPPNRMPTINLDALKTFSAALHEKLTDYLGLDGASGGIQISPTKWATVPFRNELIPFLEAEVKKAQAHDVKTCGCDACFNTRTQEHQRLENERLKLAAAAKAAAARLIQYLQQGLLDNQHNREQWAAFEAQLPKEVELSAELVDQFIAGWKSVLQWGPPPTPAPAPAPAEPEQVVLKDGSLQKGLDESPSHGWTVHQLKDWFARSEGQKKLRQQQYGGSSRSSWFKADSRVI